MRKALLPSALALALATCGAVALARAPKVIHDQTSEFGRIIVRDDDGKRALVFEEDGAIQSQVTLGKPLQLELPYTRSAMLGLAAVPSPKRILVVGVGGGAMPMFLHTLYPEASIDAVDIDPAVVAVAREHFGLEEDARLRAHVGDGRAFVEKSSGGYDLIFLDAYGASSIPLHLATLEFLASVRARLSDRGAVVGNVWSPYWNKLYGSMRGTYAEAFGSLCVFTVPQAGNRIFIAYKSGAPVDPARLATEGARLSKAKKLPFDLGALAANGCLSEPGSTGELLRDPKPAAP